MADWSIDVAATLTDRARKLQKLRDNPKLLQAAKLHYKTHPWDFIRDWGMTYDPRRLEAGGVPSVPFIPWPRQVDYLKWLYGRWQAGERGIVEKSRDCGVTWLSVGFAVALWCCHHGVAIGFGSRKETLVDRLGDPDSIFEKIRHMVACLPVEFLPEGFNPKQHATYMRMLAPKSGSSITGEAGDNIGRGGRKSIYFVDEAAFLERQEAVDAALSATTNCQIDVSTFNGSGNLFFQKRQRFDGTPRHFVFDWREDPRKDEAWYNRQVAEQPPEIVAQEIDRDPEASMSDAFIPAKWVRSAVGAHEKLGIPAEGIRVAGFDPADTGDAKAVVVRRGPVVIAAEELTAGDITQALPWAYAVADDNRADVLVYDGDGMGAPVLKVDLQRRNVGRLDIAEYRGSGQVDQPDARAVSGDGRSKTNRDTYLNYRAQTWTALRERFRRTHDAIEQLNSGKVVNIRPEQLISIPQNTSLMSELSRPKRIFTENGKIAVESKKAMRSRGVQSPNLADALVMAFSVTHIVSRTEARSFEPDFEV